MRRDAATELPLRAVKICGTREPAHARAAVLAGADLIGFIFAPARRQVTAETAAACVAAGREAAGRRVLAVGVFVNATAEEMNRVAEIADLDLLQLHGEEAPALLRELRRPAIKAVRPRPGATPDEVLAALEAFREADTPPIAFLVDGFDPAHYGGEGVRTDWRLAAALAGRVPLVLAGGLASENVAEAIRAVVPRGVDVSSGVETDGVKDVAKIRAFVAAAKGAFATVGSPT